MSVIIALLSLIPVLLTGDFIYEHLLRARRWPLATHLTLVFALGSGCVALTLFLVSLLAHRFALTLTIAFCLLLSLTQLYRHHRAFWSIDLSFPVARLREQQVAAILALPFLLVVILLIVASSATDLGFDGLVTWGFKGKLAFTEGGWPVAYFTNPLHQVTHPDYPLLLPSLEAWVYTFLTRVDEQTVKVLFLLFYLGLLALFYEAIRPYFSPPLTVFYTGLLATTPYLASLAALSGYADVPLAVFLLGAAIFLSRWLAHGTRSYLLLGAILSALAVWVKREGTIYWLFNTTAVSLAILFWHRKTSNLGQKFQLLSLYFGPAILIVLPWFVFRAWHQVPNSDFSSINLVNAIAGSDRLPIIMGRLVGQYLSLGRWGLVWIIFGLVSLGRWQALRHPPTFYLWGSAVFPILALLFTFLFSVFEPLTEHIDLSLERLFLHALPLAWFFIATQTSSLDTWFHTRLHK